MKQVRLLNRDLPENVNLLTFEPRSDGDFLLRLEHSTFEDYSNERDIQSLSTTVDLKVHIIFYITNDIRAAQLLRHICLFERIYLVVYQSKRCKRRCWEETNGKRTQSV